MVTDKDPSVKNRVVDHFVSAFASGIVILFVGWITGFVEIKSVVANLQTRFVAHEKQNADYRERMVKEKENEDRKWDARIQRIENCFIIRNCGIK